MSLLLGVLAGVNFLNGNGNGKLEPYESLDEFLDAANNECCDSVRLELLKQGDSDHHHLESAKHFFNDYSVHVTAQKGSKGVASYVHELGNVSAERQWRPEYLSDKETVENAYKKAEEFGDLASKLTMIAMENEIFNSLKRDARIEMFYNSQHLDEISVDSIVEKAIDYNVRPLEKLIAHKKPRVMNNL